MPTYREMRELLDESDKKRKEQEERKAQRDFERAIKDATKQEEKTREQLEKQQEALEKASTEQERLERLGEMGIKPFDTSKVPQQRCDHPNTMENSTATILWIVAMIISLLFQGGWILCIIETIIWLKFITRYKN